MYQAALAAVTAPAFRTAPARDKQEILWSFISNWPVRTAAVDAHQRHADDEPVDQTCVSAQGIRPGRRCETAPDEGISCVGTAAKMRFVADGTHPFTGMFATGGVGFVRASLAVGMPKYSPAAAFKFAAMGRIHRGICCCTSHGAHASEPGFFERAPTNHTLAPITFPNTLMLPLLRFWLSPISSPIELQRLDHLAAVTNNGTVVEHAVAPELGNLDGADEVRNDPASREDFRELLAAIPSGSLLYRMYGKASRSAQQVYIGSVTTESGFVASEFGDCILAFQHAWTANGTK